MMSKFVEVTKKIRTRGYWVVNFYPASNINYEKPLEALSSRQAATELLLNNRVSLRGWDYPHVPEGTLGEDQNHNIYMGAKGLEAWVDHALFKEVFRYTPQGQFYHLMGMREDWFDERDWFTPDINVEAGSSLDFVWTTHTLTEIFLFIGNLCRSGIYKENIRLKIELRGTYNRSLGLFEASRGRVPLSGSYTCMTERVILTKEDDGYDILHVDQIQEDSLGLARKYIYQLLTDNFGWDTPSMGTVEEDQKRLIERRL